MSKNWTFAILCSNVVTLIFVNWIFIGDGLKCEQCTSYEHTKCGDPFYHEDGTVKTTEFLEECPAPEQGKPAYDMCRKIYQNGKFPKN